MNRILEGDIRPIKNHIIVYGMNFDERKTKGGIIIRSDDAKEHGIRPRWAKVYAVGPEQIDIEPGMWVLVAHGRWTRKFKYEIDGKVEEIRGADPKDVMGFQWEEPDDSVYSDAPQRYS